MKRFYKLLIIPCIVAVVGLYVIGANCVLRIDRTDSVQDRAEEASDRNSAVTADTEADGSAEAADASEGESRVNINTATKEELMTIDGIGEIYSERIIEQRERIGFTSVEQLLEVEGITRKKLDRIRDSITVE